MIIADNLQCKITLNKQIFLRAIVNNN